VDTVNGRDLMSSRNPQAPRLLIAAAVSLVIGAVVSLAVAVGFGLWGTVRGPWGGSSWLEGGRLTGQIDSTTPPATLDAPTGVYGETDEWLLNELPRNGIFSRLCVQGAGITDSYCWVTQGDGTDPHPAVWLHRSGWPVRALQCNGPTTSDAPFVTAFGTGWRAPPWLVCSKYWDWPGQRQVVRPPVPLRPMPLGFAINSVVFGSVPFAMYVALGPGKRAFLRSLHHHRDRRRGRCPSCGYSREGLAGEAVCPECGTGGVAPRSIPQRVAPTYTARKSWEGPP